MTKSFIDWFHVLLSLTHTDHENDRRNGTRRGGDEEEYDEDDEPLAGPSTATESTSRAARLERRLLNEVSSSQNSSSPGRVFAHEVDHNYLQPDRMRNTRRTLSRHQRNADELDPLQGLPGTAAVASTSRLRSSTTTTTTTTIIATESTIMQRRNYLSRSTTATPSLSEVTVQVSPMRPEALNGGGVSSARQRSLQSGSRVNEPVRNPFENLFHVRLMITS